MNNVNFVFSILLLLVFTSCSFVKKSTNTVYVENESVEFITKRDAVISIFKKGDDGTLTKTGHGFIVNKTGIAYTNAHILPSANDYVVKVASKSYDIESIIAIGEKNEIVKFKISNPELDSFPNIDFAEHSPYSNDSTYAIGLRNNKELFYFGEVSSVMYFDGVGEGILTTIPVFDDLDGAPILDHTARVVGIFSLPLSEKFEFNFALSLENFRKLKDIGDEKVIFPILTYEELVKMYGEFYDSLNVSEQHLQPIFDSIIDGWNMFVRIDAMTEFIRAFKHTLEIPGSYLYPFDSLRSIKKIYAPDDKFRIFNWTLKFDKQSASFDKIMYRYLGVIQFNNPDSLEYIPLFDGKKNIEFGMEEDTFLNNESWYGVQYFDIQMIKKGKEKYYLLLGWDGFDDISDKKVIEVLWFDEDRMPVFGAPIFHVEEENEDGELIKKTKYRKIFQYNDISIMALKFMPEKNAIVFDHLVPREKKHKNKPWLFVPDGTYNAFFIKGTSLKYKDWLYKNTTEEDRHSKKTEGNINKSKHSKIDPTLGN